MKTSFPKRLLALLLVLCMVIPMAPALTLPAKAAAAAPVVVIAGSDFQANSDEAGATTVKNILTTIKKDYPTADGFLFAGDYEVSTFTNVTESTNGVNALKGAVDSIYSGVGSGANAVYVQGNHDPDSMVGSVLAPNGANDPASGAYGVYALNENMYSWYSGHSEQQAIDTAADLKIYLDAKLSAGYKKPIFVVSHLPLHYTMRTKTSGDCAYANHIFDVLNEAAGDGLNIIFLFGHHHSNSWLDSQGGSAIYYTKGDKINIAQSSTTNYVAKTLNFTYLNAGFVGYYSTTNSTAGVEKDLTMTVFEILGDNVKISRYSANGQHDLKSRGVANSAYSEPFSINDRIYSSPQTTSPSNRVENAGVIVYADGVTAVNAKVIPSGIPGEYQAYMTYDIDPVGYTQGTSARVVMPVDATFDASASAVIIDHATGVTHTSTIMDGTVSFDTDHFGTYSVAQNGAAPTVATGTMKVLKRAGSAAELQEGVPYVISDYNDNWYHYLLTNTVAYYESTSTNLPGLLLDGEPRADTPHVWYIKDGNLVYGSKSSSNYLLVSTAGVSIGAYNASNAAAVYENTTKKYGADDLMVHSTAGGHLNRRGGGADNYVATYYSNHGYSLWHFDAVVDGAVTVTATPARSALTTAQLTNIATAVDVDGVVADSYVITWYSSDESVATVDSNGCVTAIRPGRVSIIGTVSQVNDIATSSDIVVKVPIHVYDVSRTEVAASVKGQFLDAALGDAVTLTPGTASGPYAIVHASGTYLFLTGRTIEPGDTGYKGNSNATGLQVAKNVDPNHFWYYDGKFMRYGAVDGPYLAYVDNVVTLSDNKNDAFNAVEVYGTTSSGVTQYNIRRGNASNKYLNVNGGASTYNVVKLFYGAANSIWYIQNVAAPELTLNVLPANPILAVGDQKTLNTTLLADGKVETDYTVTWSVADSSVATISGSGILTAKAEGKTTVTCKLTSVYGKSNLSDMTIKIPVTVTAKSLNYVIASGTTVPSHEKITNLTAGTASGPYVIIHSDSKWLLTHDVLYTDSENYNGRDSVEGISVRPVDELADPPLWYYDGTALKAGYADGDANYLIYDSTTNMVTIGEAGLGSTFDMIGRGGSNGTSTHYWIGTSGIPTASGQTDELKTSRYLNQLGGGYYNIVSLWMYHSASGAEQNGSKWYIHAYTPAQPVTLMVSPAEDVVGVGDTTTLTPTVTLNGVHTDSYTITWASTDTSVATVSNGVVTGVSGGRTTIIATLSKAGGKETLMSVDIPISVAEMKGNTAETTLGPALVQADPVTDGAGGPYVIVNMGTKKILTGTENYHTSHATGLWMKSKVVGDFTDLWYYDGHDLIYGDPEATDRIMVYENEIVSLGNSPTTAMGPLYAATAEDRIGTFSIAAPDKRALNQLGGAAYDAVGLYGHNANSDIGSAWYFYGLTGERDVVLTVTPESSEIQITGTTQLNASLTVDGVEQTEGYLLSWTSLNPEVAEVTSDGQVIPVGHGDAEIKVTLRKLNGERVDYEFYAIANVTVSNIASATIDSKFATVNQHTDSSVELGPTITIHYKDGTTKNVKLTTEHLRNADGTKFYANIADTHENLQVVYGGFAVCTDFTLEVVGLPDYPEYPNKGAVMIDKEAKDTVNFQSSGLAEVELRVSGIPADKGVDVIIMLDTSSSMTNTDMGVPDARRLDVLCESLNNLLTTFQAPNEDGTPKDINVAIGEFNRYYWNETLSDHTQHSTYVNPTDKLANVNSDPFTGSAHLPAVFTGSHDLSIGAFVAAETLGTNPFYTTQYEAEDSVKSMQLSSYHGTNYDYAFDAIYQMADAVNKYNAEQGKDRDLYVIFMSDGAPFQFNFTYGVSPCADWNNWLNGTMEPSMFGVDSNREYYNEEGKHWMAEAIKGKRTEKYKVIRKNDSRDVNGDGILYINGLGATMYSIGMCMKDDNQIKMETMDGLIDRIGSTSDHVFHVSTAPMLQDAFDAIAGDIMNAVSNAAFIDTMGPEYDLKLGNHDYRLNGTDTTFTDNVIRVKQYEIWTYAEMELGQCTAAQVGTRKATAPVTLEEVTFNADGSAAYSSVIGSGTNILKDGVIYADKFWYNTTDQPVDITLKNGSKYSLAPETFYWNVGTISTNELALTYYVYLTGSMQGTRPAGSYPTNTDATLYYTNYIGNDCKLVAPIPEMVWGHARVGYGFYLVDKNGVPLVNPSTGLTGSFDKAVKFSQPIYQEFNTNGQGVQIKASSLTLPAGYVLYDTAAEYHVTVDNDGAGTMRVFAGQETLTSYITGMPVSPVLAGDAIGTPNATTGYASANTTVWFALVAQAKGEVGYGFYLVNKNGKMISNQKTGATTAEFDNAVKLTEETVQDLVNGTATTLIASELLPAAMNGPYKLYDDGAKYTVLINANGSGSTTVYSNGKVSKGSTYVKGLPTDPYLAGSVSGTKADYAAYSFATEDTTVWFAVYATLEVKDDAVVIDYGLGVNIHPAVNDIQLTNGVSKIYGIKQGDHSQDFSLAKPSGLTTALNTAVEMNYGSAMITNNGSTSMSNAVIRYTPKDGKMEMPTEEVITYAVYYNGDVATNGYYFGTVTIIPATTIYYEDNFVTYASTTTVKKDGKTVSTTPDAVSKWQRATDGNTYSDTQEENRVGDSLKSYESYGSDDAYNNCSTYSLGAAQWLHAGYTANGDGSYNYTSGTAEFTFWGTGFDVISKTSSKTGVIMVRVYDADTGASVKNYMVDTYYGCTTNYYRLTNTFRYGRWIVTEKTQITKNQMKADETVPTNPKAEQSYYTYITQVEADSSADGVLYQVPVMKVDDLGGYGHYRAVITVSYNYLFNHGQYGDAEGYDFYLDAIRIYNPAGDGIVRDEAGNVTSTLINDAYLADGEAWPTFVEIRDLLLSAEQYNNLGTSTVNGAIFIDSNAALSDDTATGLPGSEIASTGKSAITDYANLGPNNELYLAKGQSVAFTFANNDNVAQIHIGLKTVGGNGTIEIRSSSSSTANSFNVKTATDTTWNFNRNHMVKGNTITVTNTGTSVISLTNLWFTHKADPQGASAASYLLVNRQTGDDALRALGLNQQETLTQPTLKLSYPSLSFEDEVRYNIHFTAENIDDVAEMGLLTFDSEVADGNVDNCTGMYPGADPKNGVYMARTGGIPAKNLVDTLYFRVYAKLTDGSYVYSDLRSYSAKKYAQSQLAGSNESLKPLVVAMLNYGAAAQQTFGYRTDELINADLTDEQKALAIGYDASMIPAVGTVTAAKAGSFAGKSGYLKKYPTVSFEGAFSLNYFLTPAGAVDGEMTLYLWDEAAYAAAEVLTAENASSVVTMTANEAGEYTAACTGIAAKDLGDTVYAAATYTFDGTTHCTGMMPYSVAAYCQSFAESNDANMNAIAQATVVYSHYAKAYFAEN